MGRTSKGALEVGTDAEFIVLSPVLELSQVFCGGRTVANFVILNRRSAVKDPAIAIHVPSLEHADFDCEVLRRPRGSG